MHLTLLRHGQTPSNVSGALDTAAPGAGLTALGRRQAAAAGSVLHAGHVDGIVASPLLRTAQTAAPLAELTGLAVVTVPGLREVQAGDLEMRRDRASQRLYLETVFAWAHGDTVRRMPGGPDGEEFLHRYDEAVAAVVAHGWERAVVVSHGAAIRVWASVRAAGIDAGLIERTPLANTGVIRVEGEPGDWRFAGWSAEPVGGEQLDQPGADDPTGTGVQA